MKKNAKKDVEVMDSGSLVSFAPLTKKARAWVKKNVQLESWQWMGGFFSVDHGYADDLTNGMLEAGLKVA